MPKNIIDVMNDTFDTTGRPGDDVKIIEIPDFITGGEIEINKGADVEDDNEELDLSGLRKDNKVTKPKISDDFYNDAIIRESEYRKSKELDAYKDELASELPQQVWQENILNNFDNPTYHLTLYVGTKPDIQLDQYKQRGVIVAETGSTTRFHIDNLEVASPVGR